MAWCQPNRLLINCRTPYSVVTASSQNDEEALGNDDGFPCCQLDPVKGFQIPRHDLSWTAAAPGFRLPASEAFSAGGALWSWTAPPATMNGAGAYTGRIVAVDLLDTNTLRGSVDLTDPAVTFTAQILPMSTRITCTLTAYHGLDRADRADRDGHCQPRRGHARRQRHYADHPGHARRLSSQHLQPAPRSRSPTPGVRWVCQP